MEQEFLFNPMGGARDPARHPIGGLRPDGRFFGSPASVRSQSNATVHERGGCVTAGSNYFGHN